MKNKKIKEIGLLLILFVILIVIIFFTPVLDNYGNNGMLIINEVMASNNYTIKDKYGNYSDYIELYNGYKYDINLKDYYLADDNFVTKKWKFPEVVIKAKSYLVVFASGRDEVYEGEIHTNFKLSNEEEVIVLTSNKNKLLSKIKYNSSIEDSAYGYDGKDYVYYYNGTPGFKNEGEKQSTPIKVKSSNVKLVISEYIVNNISNSISKDGNYYSMIEIYNKEDYDINLEGYYLSDNINSINKYKFPSVVIKAKSYLVIYMSLLNQVINDEVHANFRLDDNSKIIILSDNYRQEIDRVVVKDSYSNISVGLYNDKWYYYNNSTFGYENSSDYKDVIDDSKDIIINEVASLNPEMIEIKNISNNDINLSGYSIGDKSGKKVNLPNITLKKDGYYAMYGSDSYSYSQGKLYLGFHINNSNEIIYLYKDNRLIDEFRVGRLVEGVSAGIREENSRVLYKDVTVGWGNADTFYKGYAMEPKFSINGGYVEAGTSLELVGVDGSDIYYTLDGSFPTNKSIKYEGKILIEKNTVVKAIAYKEGYLESQVVSRTYLVGRKHDLPFISISGSKRELNDLLVNYTKEQEKKISFEYYEANGNLGVEFIGGTKLTGMDSRKRDQKSMAIYLRKRYGLQEVTYPFFKDSDVYTYSSFTLRNAGEDPYAIRIQDTVLTYALKNQMDIDMQDYRAVVVYLNGEYYGLYNLREKLNGDYLKSNYGVEDGTYDLIKYKSATKGTVDNYNAILKYIRNNDTRNKEVYEYIKNNIDVQELCNYLIVESYYGNTDQGNIRYWKSNNGKWRFMLYDLDWSLYNVKLDFNYTVFNTKSPAVTYVSSVYEIARKLYQNSEFRDMYLKTFGKHLNTTFKPDRMNKIVDELAKEIEKEMPYHIERWPNMHSSMGQWNKNIERFKNKLTDRYNYVVKNIKREFNLSEEEYNKYFVNGVNS